MTLRITRSQEGASVAKKVLINNKNARESGKVAFMETTTGTRGSRCNAIRALINDTYDPSDHEFGKRRYGHNSRSIQLNCCLYRISDHGNFVRDAKTKSINVKKARNRYGKTICIFVDIGNKLAIPREQCIDIPVGLQHLDEIDVSTDKHLRYYLEKNRLEGSLVVMANDNKPGIIVVLDLSSGKKKIITGVGKDNVSVILLDNQ